MLIYNPNQKTTKGIYNKVNKPFLTNHSKQTKRTLKQNAPAQSTSYLTLKLSFLCMPVCSHCPNAPFQPHHQSKHFFHIVRDAIYRVYLLTKKKN
jgi:hypothetical protein